MAIKPKAAGGRAKTLAAFALLAWAAGAACGRAQYIEEPPSTANLPRLRYIKFDIEAQTAKQSASGGASQPSTDQLYMSPALGIGYDYFIYHPDLLAFSILAEPGYVWQQSGQSGSMSHENDLLLNGNLNATLLQLKPYYTTIFANAGRNEHQYDFFNTVIEESRIWGATTGYREGPVPTTIAYAHSTLDSSGFGYNSSSDQTTVNLHAMNQRKQLDITDLSYQYSEYNSTSGGSGQNLADSTTLHYVTVTDTEHFNRSVLTSTLLYDRSDANDGSSDNLNALLDYGVEHTPQLRSSYGYSFSRYSTDGGESLLNSARAGLQHQLYDSLTTSADVHGSKVNNSYTGSTLDAWSVGTSLSVGYSKRLSPWARLFLGNTAAYEWTEQQSSGTALLIPNEAHTLFTGIWVPLNQPQDITIISVTTDAASGNKPLTENVDYNVNRSANPWQIQINPLSQLIHSGDTVLVTYTVQPAPSGNYAVLSDQVQMRLDLWNGMVGIYARYNYNDNQSSIAGFVIENSQEFQAGADFTRRGLRLDANYTERTSSFFTYHSFGLSEAYNTQLSSQSTVGVDLHQRWSFYPGSDGATNQSYEVTYYDSMARYDWHPIHSLNWSVEAGYSKQQGGGLNQDLFVVRSYLNWVVGKLDMHLGYQYQDQQYTAETRSQQFVFFRARRNF